MNKKTINTAVFFTILLWLGVYFLIIKHKIIPGKLSALSLGIIIFINLVIIAISRYLIPAFEFILKITGKIGSFIFGVIATLVYFFILTPIAFYKRLSSRKLMQVEIEKNRASYYEDWKPSDDIEKQY